MSEDELAVFRRQKIGFVFQAFNLVSSINVYENVVLPLGLDGKEPDEDYVNDILKTLGIEDKIENLPLHYQEDSSRELRLQELWHQSRILYWRTSRQEILTQKQERKLLHY